jgi:hypothetical protein
MGMTTLSQHNAVLGLTLVRQPYSGHRPHKRQSFNPYLTKTVWPRTDACTEPYSGHSEYK